MVIGSLTSKTAIGLISLGAVAATGVGIWQLQSQSPKKKTIGLPNNPYRWLETDLNKKDDDNKWKQKISEYEKEAKNSLNLSFSTGEEEESKIKKIKNSCLSLKNEEFEGEIPEIKRDLTEKWCVTKKTVKELLVNLKSKFLSFENNKNENEWNKKFEEYGKATSGQKKGFEISGWTKEDKSGGIKKIKEKCKELQDQEVDNNFENEEAFQKWCMK